MDDVVIVHAKDVNPNDQAATVHLISQLGTGEPVPDLDTYFQAVEATHQVAPTGTSIEVDGFELVGYDLTGAEDAPLFGTSRHPAPILANRGPDAFSRVFVGETPSGILSFSVRGSTVADAEAMLPALGTMAATIEFVGPGLDPALPRGESIEPHDAGPPPPAADEDATGALPPLGAPFAPAGAT